MLAGAASKVETTHKAFIETKDNQQEEAPEVVNQHDVPSTSSTLPAWFHRRQFSRLPKSYTEDEDHTAYDDDDLQLEKVKELSLREHKPSPQSFSTPKKTLNGSTKKHNPYDFPKSSSKSSSKSLISKKRKLFGKGKIPFKLTEPKPIEKQTDDEGKQLYCYCRKEYDGSKMIGCDGPDCKYEWFHYKCVGIKRAPAKDKKWYCDDCKKQL